MAERHYHASDGKHYEKRIDAKGLEPEPVCIDDEIPFEIPESWEWVRLESVTTYIQRGKSPKYSSVKKYPVVAQKCNQWSGFSLELAKFIDPNTVKSYTKERVLQDGDLLWNSTGLGTLGRMAVYDSTVNEYGWAVADSHVTVIRTLPEWLDYRYAFAYFAGPSVQSVIEDQASGSTKQKELGLETVKSYLTPFPPVNEQRRIVEQVVQLDPYIDDFDALETAREALDAELPDRLRKSVLQMAVQGKLVEQDPADEPASELLERIREQRRQLVTEGKMKLPKGGESIIYRASDGGYYEKRGKSEPVCIDDKIPFEIPESWAWCRLKSLGEIVGGGTPKTHDASLWAQPNDGIPWITPADMKNVAGKYVAHGERFLSERGLSESSAQLMPAGAVVMSSRAPIGYLAITACPIATNQGFKSIVPICREMNAWVLVALDALMDDIKRRASGTTFKEISGTEFGETLIPMPPLPEQNRIVTSFESVIAVIG